MSKWFRVEDVAENRVVLVEAEDVRDACVVYLRDYPPDLYSKEATTEEIATWIKDPWPWQIVD